LDITGRTVVCIITGNGLKDPDLAVTSAVNQPIEVEPTMEALENIGLSRLE
jgi:threonine synthase